MDGRASIVALGVVVTTTLAVPGLAGAHPRAIDPHHVPIGDGKLTTSGPRRGYLYLCHPQTGGGGAQVNGPWIHADGTYDVTAKAVVDGDVAWPQAVVQIERAGTTRTITSNGLPTNHTTGIFPIQPTDDAYQYDRNPNRIREQALASYSLKAVPKKGPPRCLGGSTTGNDVGIATNGVRIFNAADAESRDAVAHEAQDHCGGHPEITGRYHYHSIPSCLYPGESDARHSGLVGWAFDGFPIFGPRGARGRLLTNADLDVCHGHTHRVTIGGKRVRTYHYHATLEFPYTVGCFRGVQ